VTGPLLGREPVITVSTVVAVLIALIPVFGWPAETVGIVAGALVVIGGLAEAALISVDRVLPLLVGVGKAVVAVVAAFGVQIPGNWVVAIMALLTVVAGLKVRDQVVAPQTPKGDDAWRSGPIAAWPGGIRPAPSWSEAEKRAVDFPTDLDTQRDAPPLPGRDDDTQVFRTPLSSEVPFYPPASPHSDDAELGSSQEQRGGKGRHSSTQEWRPSWGHRLT
jgi:hypothetical protein